ncbi:universal stress protein UspA-like protein [Mycolicibacterium phlei]|jgi:nucleotide-binding universal stress UspA family protein|uniref:Universal stress protein n=1 Tax=Mycolicibacterium phlei DSM 43239 = CCUG 21000 TaxID=1226750 RepID=A0A5N5UP98_MYCPH|nr:universal stress protein [Mycolicibacterium phlei]VEG08811.1 universal stress protein UspA-like protein [Mycobacteroides chelonae]AMO60693.1 Universal stress protein [Mycolicibacterium phlei]EID14891.1 universal stress protein UspA-like protein [Mycolicibacterium phlei RIVM601174]KAB7751434.1 universal stress protein [Mycolicibacterium phlei DSM 43239 = CCUG 21000]KXW68075.1 universal stress protein [Mycolicibacterium phlei DSM 43239 = CCUG 21000]
MAAQPNGILVGVDGSPDSEAAIRWATREAILHEQPVKLLHAIPPVVVTWPVAYLETSYLEAQEANAREIIENAQQLVQKIAADSGASAPKIQTKICNLGAPSAMVSESRDAYMSVCGSRGLGAIGRALLGSVSGGLLHHGQGPIVVVPAEATVDEKAPVLLGIDGSPASEEATALAFDEASRRGADVLALHAWSDVVYPALGGWQGYEEEAQALLAERLAGWRERYPDVTVHRRVVCDQPAKWLIDLSEDAQLVVVGSHGRGGFKGLLLGSVAARVAQGAKAPTIVVRPR